MTSIPSLSHLSAGFITVLVGYSSSTVIIFQAAEAAGATNAELISWLWALGVGMAISSIGLSLHYRQPVLTAWSTPGGALLVTSLSGLNMAEAIGAFMFSSVLITLCGISGWLDRLMTFIPTSLASAMLAGVLMPFGLGLFTALENQLLMVGLMLSTFLLIKTSLPRYAVPITLLMGLIIANIQGDISFGTIHWQLASPVFIWPEFSFSSLIGVGLPLFIVTMASQNVPGLATLRAHGYTAPASPLISWTGLMGIILAPFGGFAFNLSAITAAICMGKEADSDAKKRYLASVSAGIFYLLAGLFAATIASLLTTLPKELIVAIAGLALLGTIASSLQAALHQEHSREATLLTFVITVSGVSILGIGSAFWGLVIGLGVYHLRKITPSTARKAQI